MKAQDNPIFIGDQGSAAVPKRRQSDDVEWTPPQKKAEVADDAIIEPVSFFQLFRFASLFDVGLIILSIVSTILSGICLPGEIIVFGTFVEALTRRDLSAEDFYALRCNGTNGTEWSDTELVL